jgi:hypothetical protein
LNLNQQGQRGFELKRCPYCYVDLPLDVRICPACKQKVGKVDRLGRAKEPIDWKAYSICIVSWIFFVFFVWWGFFREG